MLLEELDVLVLVDADEVEVAEFEEEDEGAGVEGIEVFVPVAEDRTVDGVALLLWESIGVVSARMERRNEDSGAIITEVKKENE